MQLLTVLFLFLAGLCVGSFCNVLILRIPRGEEFVKSGSHCMSCGHALKWYENIPLLSFALQKGRCRSCGRPISLQYPIIEALCGAMWALVGLLFPGSFLNIALYCALFSILCVIALIDWRSFEIPNGLNLAVFVLGLIRLFSDLGNWKSYVIGFFAVSLFFLLLWFLTGGAGIGMGDVKLMAAAGLMLGWQRILLAMILGCVLGSVIHIIRMKRGAGRKLAFGPYLSAGIWLSLLFGQSLISWYTGLLGF